MGKQPEKGLRLTRLQVRNWRNFTKFDVELARRAFLVGPNASGKSNLLDVFRFLHDIVSVGGGFQAAVQRRGGVKSLRSLAARRAPQIEIDASVGAESRPDRWRYRLEFNQDPKRRPVIRNEEVWDAGRHVFKRPDAEDQRDAERLTQTRLEQVHANLEFRELAEFFSTIRYLHIVPQIVREPERGAQTENDPYGGDFLEQIAGTNERTQHSRLRRIRQALKIAVPQLQELELSRDVRGTPHLRGRYENWRKHGAWQTEERFSDGTLRLIGLLWAVLEKAGPLLLEEPELSLHPEVVRYIPQMFARVQKESGRQILVSTHSPELLRDEGVGLDEVLLLKPVEEGSQVSVAKDNDEVVALLEGRISLADAVMPQTRPHQSEQLALFPDLVE